MINNFNPNEFLAKHWQKSPCLIKNGFSHPPSYISADELAGLSLEDEVESRIIRCDNEQWQMQSGPFDEQDFNQLPESHWTLLVQTLDYWLPETQALLNLFRFIPRWRFDDLMVSYATDGGGVGPHFDNYDVFLIQTEGERRWRVGKTGELTQSITVIDGLKHLESFEPLIDVVMQPGDILYVPPETAHWGVSVGDSIGYSVGYRSPQTRDILALLANHFDCAKENKFFPDPYRNKANTSNKIEPELIEWASNEIKNIFNNQELIADLLSNFLSQSKIDTVEFDPLDLQVSLANSKRISIVDGINANWLQLTSAIQLNIEGEKLILPNECQQMIETLLSGQSIEIKGLQQSNEKFDFSEALATLIDMGYFLVK
jgi:50S ribosomal protein L16 3-hydroxylase